MLGRSSTYLEIINTNNMAGISPEFDKFVQEKIEEWKVPGLSLAIIKGDDIHTKVLRLGLSIRPIADFIVGIWLCNIARQESHYGNYLRLSQHK